MEQLAAITNVVIIGAGKGGTALLGILHNDPTTNVLGMVDINPDAKGLVKAKKMGIPVAKYVHGFLENSEQKIDILIDVTGEERIQQELQNSLPLGTSMIGGITAKFIWALIDARRDKQIIEQKYHQLKATLETSSNEEIIFGINPMMQEIRQMILQVARTPATVLITGETGTGKEMMAMCIQRFSHLKDEPFVKINCTAFSPSLLESELFGYKKGAFTGAMKDKVGLLEKGDGGTIFLDEIGDISLDMQVKLLRFLQFGEVRPVGSTETKIIRSRIIAATNRNLEQLIKAGKFRADLFYRINSFILELPALRDRKEDIPVLVYHFLKLAVIKMNKKVETIANDAMESLNNYQFPGNIRELQSIIERAVILCNGKEIDSSHLPVGVQSSKTFNYQKGILAAKEVMVNQFERQALQHYLIKTKGKVTEAALLAKVPRRTFYRMMEKHQIKKEHYKNR